MEAPSTSSIVQPTTSSPDRISFSPDWKRFRPVEDLLIPVLSIDEEGTIQHVSKAARRLLEYKSDATLDAYFFSHVHGKNLYRVMQDVAHMVCCGQQQASWLLRLRTGHGRWRWYRATAQNRLHQSPRDILIRLTAV
jgi:PAS domain-containing protein